MIPPSFSSRTSIRLRGKAVPGALERHRGISGYDQKRMSQATVTLIGAGGLGGGIGLTLVRKGVGCLKIFDPDTVEASNLNRQRFFRRDLGSYKAVALARNLKPECTHSTALIGVPLEFVEATERGRDLSCDVAVCGVDNNPARISAGHYFRMLRTPVVFVAVSAQADHGYVFVQEATGPCIGCLFPDAVNDDRFPCPGTPAMADTLQVVSALAAYAVDTCVMRRKRAWNYRRVWLSDGAFDSSQRIPARSGCPFCQSR
ncbi:MAG: ThiF family adenylyltransferase [Bryobacteraceae bacterium]